MSTYPPIKQVVIPVAGLGTRGLPFTKEVPKEMVPIIDKPAIHFIVEEVIASGVEQVIFITSKGKTALEDYFDPSLELLRALEAKGKKELAFMVEKLGRMVDVVSVRQKEPLGLGHAVLCAKRAAGGEPFAVCLGDEIYPPWTEDARKSPALGKLMQTASQTGDHVVGVMEVPPQDTSLYGIIDTRGQKVGREPVKVFSTVEKPDPSLAPSRYAITGRYVFFTDIFDALKEVKPGRGGEIQLTDALDIKARETKLTAALIDSPRYDVGSPLSYLKAQVDAGLQREDLKESFARFLKEKCDSL